MSMSSLAAGSESIELHQNIVSLRHYTRYKLSRPSRADLEKSVDALSHVAVVHL